MRPAPIARSAFPRLAAATSVCALALGCGIANVNRNTDRHPNVMTGVSATVIMPGQTAPALPVPGARNAAVRSGPGGTSGSSGGFGAGTGTPGSYAPPAGAPGASAPPPAAGPYGGAAAGSAPSARGPEGAYGAAPGVPQQPPGGAAPSTGNFVFIGGSEEDIEKRQEYHNEPLWLKPLLFPLAVVAYPFTKAWEAIEGEPTGEGPDVPRPSPQPAAPPTREQMQAAQEARALDQMERELVQRGQPGGAVAAPVPSAPARAGAAPSIAEELEALRARREGRAQPAPAPLAAPPDPSSSSLRPATLPSVASAPPSGGGLADRVEDRDRDGRPDHFIYRDGDRVVREVFEENGDGAPDRIVYFDETGARPARVEEDANGDGRVDTWTQYQGDQIARRRADSDGDGTVDTWTFYQSGQVARLEQDTNGDGFHDRIEFYDGGRRVREELDRNGDGRPDVITRFDGNDLPLEREEDQDADGILDMRSYYNAGKLARREVMNEAALSAAGARLTDPSAAPPDREPGT